MDKAEKNLLQKARAGDEYAFKKIIINYESKVAATVIGILGYCNEAEDIGQETFIRFYKALKKFRGESSIGTYLTRIAINLCKNELKKRNQNRQQYSYDIPTDNIADRNTNIDQIENQKIVQMALQKIKIKFRTVLVLRLMDGYSTEETAKILKIPVGTVLSRLSRGQNQLREILTPLLGEKS